jgi:YidC/Oxa1 family membrane protein insertase
MDKRTALAFFLMFVVLMVWSSVFSPEKTGPKPDAVTPEAELVAPETPADVEGETGSVAAEPAGSAETDEPATWASLAPDAQGPLLEIETDRYVAELDLVGADLRSWILKNYETTAGAPVQLIPEWSLDAHGQRAHALRILLEDRVRDLARVRFEPSGNGLVSTGDPARPWRLRLDADRPTAELLLTADQEDGGTFTLRLFLDNGGTAFDARARYDSPRNATEVPRLEVSWPGGISNTEPDTTHEYNEFKAAARVGADTHKKKFHDLAKDGGEKGRETLTGTVAWAGVLSQYFTSLVHFEEVRSGVVRFDGDHGRRLQTFSAVVPLVGAGGPGLDYAVYMGPIDYDRLEHIDPALTTLIDLGPTIFRPISRLTLKILIFLHQFIPNYGLVIILLSVATKFLFYPLTKSSTRSMREMQLIQPEMQKIREKYKDDQQRQSMEMMKLYKEHKVNPLAGCLPLLVQMPVFWALFTVLRRTIELRQAPFMLWIDDLSRPDVLFQLPVTLPVLGDKFALLPLLMAVGMWAQTKIGTPKAATAGGGAMASQQRMMTTFMPIFMFFIFYNTPSGLVLYWLVNTVLTAVQTWQIHRTAPQTLAEKKAQLA